MNNLKDISKEKIRNLAGYMQEELEFYFADWIDETAEELNIGRQELLAKVKSYYDGFSFDGKTKGYNPLSVSTRRSSETIGAPARPHRSFPNISGHTSLNRWTGTGTLKLYRIFSARKK